MSSAAILLGGLRAKVLNNGLGWTCRILEHLLFVRHFVLLSDLARDEAFHFCIKYGTPEGTFPFRYLSEKKLKQGN